MTNMAHRRHLHMSEAGAAGLCDVCGEQYHHEIHKQALGPNSQDLIHLSEDERIEAIATEVRKGQVVGVLLEFGIGKVERYIRKMALRHPDIRMIDRAWELGALTELVRFGPQVNG
jgi:hypothetical protein